MNLPRKFFAIYILRPSPSQKYKNSKLEVDQNNALEYPIPISWPAYKSYRVNNVGSIDPA